MSGKSDIRTGYVSCPARRSGLTARHEPRKDLVALGRARALIDFLHRFELRAGETIRHVAVPAQERGRIEVAAARIAKDPVFDSVESVAGLGDGVSDHLRLGRGNIT